MHNNPFKFFDDILMTLSEDYYRIYTVDQLTKIVFPETEREKNITKLSQIVINETRRPLAVVNALIFLNKEGLVHYDANKGEAFINTKGFLKIKTKGFEREYNEAKWNLRIERFNKIATPIIAVSALIVGIVNFLYK